MTDPQGPTYVWSPSLRPPKHSAYVKRDGDRWIAYCTAACDEEFVSRTTNNGAFLDTMQHRSIRG